MPYCFSKHLCCRPSCLVPRPCCRSSSFLIDVQSSYQSGFTMLQVGIRSAFLRCHQEDENVRGSVRYAVLTCPRPRVPHLLCPQHAKKLNTSFAERFAIFCREQERVQKSTSAEPGEDNDLIQYVEFQRALKNTKRAHREALQAISMVWTHLCAYDVKFGTISNVIKQMDEAIREADRTYRTVMQRHSSNVQVRCCPSDMGERGAARCLRCTSCHVCSS